MGYRHQAKKGAQSKFARISIEPHIKRRFFCDRSVWRASNPRCCYLWSAGFHEFLGDHFRFPEEGRKVVSVAFNVSVKTEMTGLIRMPSK